MKYIIKVILYCGLLYINNTYGQGNSTCANAQAVCPGQSFSYQAGVNVGNAQVGPNYGCLGSQPNPAWFYVNIFSAGNLYMVIAGSAKQDVDFICWGPFNSIASICSNLSSANAIDCSYSSSPTETLNISSALPGEFYVFMVTNFSNVVQNINFNTSGTAGVSCFQSTAMAMCAGG